MAEWLAHHRVWCLLQHDFWVETCWQFLLNTSPQLEVRPKKYGRLRFENCGHSAKVSTQFCSKLLSYKFTSYKGHVKTNKEIEVIPTL